MKKFFILSFVLLFFLVGVVSADCDSKYYQINVGLKPLNSLNKPDFCYVYDSDGNLLQSGIINVSSDSSLNYGELGFTSRYTVFSLVCVRNNTVKCTDCGNKTSTLVASDFKLINQQNYEGVQVCMYSYVANFTFNCAASKSVSCKAKSTVKPTVKPTTTPTPVVEKNTTGSNASVNGTVVETTVTPVVEKNTTGSNASVNGTVVETTVTTTSVQPTKLISTLTPSLFSELLLGFIVSGTEDSGLNCLQTCAKNYNNDKKLKGKTNSFLCYYDFDKNSCVYK